MADFVWVAVHRPVNVGGQVIHHRRESASVIPDALVEKLGQAEQNACVKISLEAAKKAFPDLFAPAQVGAFADKAAAAPAAEASK